MMLTIAVMGPGASGVAGHNNNAPGNNGTVKVHDGPNEPRPEVRNQPHVCTFHLHFFFADAGQSGTWEIQKWAPGPKGAVVLRGTYHTDSNGEDRQPEQGAYSLPNGHYKLFWDGDTGKHDKMKVFWVKCAASPTPTPTPNGTPTPTPPATPTPTPGGGGGGATPTPTPTPGGGGGTPTPTPTPGGGGGGATPTPTPGGGGATPTPTPGGGVGGVTGTPPAATLPPTDTALDETSTTAGDGWRAALVALAGLLAAALLITPTRTPATRRIRRR
jgi:hypothetical protein